MPSRRRSKPAPSAIAAARVPEIDEQAPVALSYPDALRLLDQRLGPRARPRPRSASPAGTKTQRLEAGFLGVPARRRSASVRPRRRRRCRSAAVLLRCRNAASRAVRDPRGRSALPAPAISRTLAGRSSRGPGSVHRRHEGGSGRLTSPPRAGSRSPRRPQRARAPPGRPGSPSAAAARQVRVEAEELLRTLRGRPDSGARLAGQRPRTASSRSQSYWTSQARPASRERRTAGSPLEQIRP